MWLMLLVWELDSHRVLTPIAAMKRSAWVNYKVVGGLRHSDKYTPFGDDVMRLFFLPVCLLFCLCLFVLFVCPCLFVGLVFHTHQLVTMSCELLSSLYKIVFFWAALKEISTNRESLVDWQLQ